MSFQELIDLLELELHPKEGGFFRETYRSRLRLPLEALPGDYRGPRSASTAIFYLLTPTSVSAMHRLRTDEVFHFYLGDAVEQLQLFPDGSGQLVRIGTELEYGARPQVVVPAGVWQGARLARGGSFALLGCTVAPGFEYVDYEHGERAELAQAYPAFADLIERLTIE